VPSWAFGIALIGGDLDDVDPSTDGLGICEGVADSRRSDDIESRGCGSCEVAALSGLESSSGRERIYSINELFTRLAAARTCSSSLDNAGSICDSSRGMNERISSGAISKKLSIHLNAVTLISCSAQLVSGCAYKRKKVTPAGRAVQATYRKSHQGK
jgi:hypothetical protein